MSSLPESKQTYVPNIKHQGLWRAKSQVAVKHEMTNEDRQRTWLKSNHIGKNKGYR